LGRLREDGGQGVVEFAMVLPFLAVLILVFIQFGKAINYWIDLTHVANEAARIATVDAPGATASGGTSFRSTVCGQLETAELKNGSGEVDPTQVVISYPQNPDPLANNSTRDTGDPVRVQVSATYHWLRVPFWNVNLGSWTIVGSATMRIERSTQGNTALDQSNVNGACA
jgi:Flp pilus assembly protein TadG